MAAGSCVPQAPRLSDAIAAVRHFNRFYTGKIGVLRHGLLDSQFSLTEVRVLYEIAHRQHALAAEIANELALDPGYLSRLLRGFASRKLVDKVPHVSDRRQNLLALTGKGAQVFAALDSRQNQEVACMLASLRPGDLERLLKALRSIEGILSSQPRDPYRQYLLRAHRPGDMGWVVARHGQTYFQEYGYDERFEALVADIVANFIRHFDCKREHCWMAEREGENVGCVFLVKSSERVAKLRLLLVEPSARGLGIGRQLIADCMLFARQAGYKKVTLWTQSELHAARYLYKEAGFELVKRARHQSWGRRDLVAEVWDRKL